MNYSSNGIIQSNYALESSHQQNRKFQVMIVSCIVKADDTSKESIQLSSKLGLRLRKILSDQSVTASSFARSFVEKSKSYIRAVCDELSGDSNSNVTLSYGDGSKTNVMIRHDTKSGKPVFVGSLLMQIKLAENGMTSLVLPKDKLYTQVQAYESFPPEVYITPAKSAPLWEASSIDGSDTEEEDDETIILLKVNEDNEIYSVKVDPPNKDIKEFTKFDTTTNMSRPESVKKEAAIENEVNALSISPKAKTKRKADTQGTKEKAGKKRSETTETAEKAKKAKKMVATKEADNSATKRKAETKEAIEKETKRSKSAKKKKAEKEVSPLSENKSPKKTKARSRSASIVKEKEDNESRIMVSPKETKARSRSASTVEIKEDSESALTSKKPKQKHKESNDQSLKKKKDKKDPNAPKRPLTTYLLFCKDARANVLKENPDAKVPQMGKLLGAKYKELSKDEKKVYEEQSSELKKQYEVAKAEYLKNNKADEVVEDDIESVDTAELEAKSKDEVAPKTVKKKRSKKNPLAPKKGLSAYMFFCTSKRTELKKSQPKMTVPEMGKVLGKMWQDISVKDKASFDEMAMKDKERYKSAMEKFNTTDVV